MAINCAALPENLLESELFGYERGAFTGAQQSKAGQIEQAAGGVLFLDEVTEMSHTAQAKFLRVLQEREFQRLGGTRTIRANVRVIAATNRDLRKAVEQGVFREDLYYRLQVFEIAIPALRNRKSDVLPLADAFLQDIARSFGRPPAGLTADAKRALMDYDWPGNVRELRNALERAAILCEGGLIAPQHLLLPTERQAVFAETTDLNEVERHTIELMRRRAATSRKRANPGPSAPNSTAAPGLRYGSTSRPCLMRSGTHVCVSAHHAARPARTALACSLPRVVAAGRHGHQERRARHHAAIEQQMSRPKISCGNPAPAGSRCGAVAGASVLPIRHLQLLSDERRPARRPRRARLPPLE